MDINLPSDLSGTKTSSLRIGDLLSQLRSAGTVEAEVIKVLNDKLLLRSRLGDILTRNTLNYKPGDRINLRLDERGREPVLKSSPAAARPTLVDASANPELARLLPESRPLLAQVTRAVAERAEARLAQQIVNLPRPSGVQKGDLLRLQSIDAGRRIEIAPLQRKAIYKALLKQLIPQNTPQSRTSLVKLMDLVHQVKREPGRAPADNLTPRQPAPATTVATPPARPPGAPPPMRAATTNSTAGGGNGGKPIPTSSTVDNPQAEQQVTRTAQRTSAAQLLAQTLNLRQPPAAPTARPGAATASAKPTAQNPAAAARPQAGASAGITIQPGSARNLASAPADARAAAPANTGGSAGSAPVSAKQVSLPNANSGATAASPRPAATAAPAPATAQPAASVTAQTPAAGANPASANIASFGNAAASAPAGEVNAPLPQLLTRLLVNLPQIDAAALKRWFQASSLVEGPARQSVAADFPRLLGQISEGERFSRELLNLVQAQASAKTDSEAQTQRALLQELWLPQIRDSARLAEQSLAQNLMQRASVGLQQETQQPLSFNLALPLLDDNQVKPLYVDLAERGQASAQEDKCWDIRISFEFSGLGPVACHIVLEGSAVAASFYSELATTRASIDGALPDLRQQLVRAGFNPGEFHSFSGKIGIDESPAVAAYNEALIDIEV